MIIEKTKPESIPLDIDVRTVKQNAALSIKSMVDVIQEFVTNSDDSYVRKGSGGLIDIEIQTADKILLVRDYAEGMSAQAMKEKLGTIGKRVSGLEEGQRVRGTNSRGAKDVATLGHVTFESITEAGGESTYSKCEITEFFEFIPPESKPASKQIRKRLNINSGTGTVVTIKFNTDVRFHQYSTLKKKISQHISFRELLKNRKVILKDTNNSKSDRVNPPRIEGKERVKVTFSVPGYPESKAKLAISRAGKPFDKSPAKNKYRLGGILIKSKHAIHEATLFDPGLERDPHATRFYGKLTCDYIDDLWNDWDNRHEARKTATKNNPRPIYDPGRQLGLTADHPFVIALYEECRKYLEPLVEEERKLAENEQSKIESQKTRKQLDKLEEAATKFMDEELEDPGDGAKPVSESRFRKIGYVITPPFSQMIKGDKLLCTLKVLQKSFPRIQVGTCVDIERYSNEIKVNTPSVELEPHPDQEGVLQAKWEVTAKSATPATGVNAKVKSISADVTIEVFDCEKDRYAHIEDFCFGSKKYTVRLAEGKKTRKNIRLFAPLKMVPSPTKLDIQTGSSQFKIVGETMMKPDKRKGIAVANITVVTDLQEAEATTLTACLGSHKVQAEIVTQPPIGTKIEIKIKDIDSGSYRSQWNGSVLEIAARHPALSRYLGSGPEFAGQDSPLFKIILAEIVADAVCRKIVGYNIEADPEEYDEADWDSFYAEYSELMTRFSPLTHKLQCPNPQEGQIAE